MPHHVHSELEKPKRYGMMTMSVKLAVAVMLQKQVVACRDKAEVSTHAKQGTDKAEANTMCQ